MSAWVKQLASQVKKHGEKNASWYCEWNEPDGSRRCKSCGSGDYGRRLAEELAFQIKRLIVLGNYQEVKNEKSSPVERYLAVREDVDVLFEKAVLWLHDKRYSTQQIGRAMGCSKTPIVRVLEKHGLRSNGENPCQENKIIGDLMLRDLVREAMEKIDGICAKTG